MSEHEPQHDVTSLLMAAADGDARASERLLPVVYEELKRAAGAHLASERAGHTLSATALVHEAYIRLAGPRDTPWSGRGHYYAAAVEAMRRILVDRARARGALKRGGGALRLTLDPEKLFLDEPPEGLLELDAALDKLEHADPQKAQLVKLRFFGGLTLEEAAVVLGISASTADRYWAFARAWLFNELGDSKEKKSEKE